MGWNLLLSRYSGLFSLFVIGFVIVMAFFLINFFKKNAAIDAQKAAAGK